MAPEEQEQRKPLIVGWPADDAGCGYYRVKLPLRSIQRMGYADTKVAHAGEDNLPVGDVIVLQRNVSVARLQAALNARDQHGCLIVVEEDDNFAALPPDNPAWKEFHPYNWKLEAGWIFETIKSHRKDPENNPPLPDLPTGRYYEDLVEMAEKELELEEPELMSLLERVPRNDFHKIHRATMKAGDLLTVTTPHLAHVYHYFNPNVAILPNCLDFEEPVYGYKPNKSDHDGVIVGWAGSLTHLKDLEHIAGVLMNLMDKYDGKNGRPFMRLMIGTEYRAFTQLFNLYPGARWFVKKIQDLLDSPLAQSLEDMQDFGTVESDCGRFIYARGVKPDIYPQMFDQVDVGIVPGRPGQSFYEGKSDLKGLEMAAKYVPIVASPTHSYRFWRSRGTGCYMARANNGSEWLKGLDKLIGDPEYRGQMAQEAHEFSRTRDIDLWSRDWMEAYSRTAVMRQGATGQLAMAS